MRRFKSHTLGVQQGSQVLFSDYEHDGDMWTGTGPREFRLWVDFDEEFAEAPVVQVGMSMWDLAQDFNQRVDLAAENVMKDGFDIVFRTWGDTRVARVRSDWIAIGDVPDEDDWDLY